MPDIRDSRQYKAAEKRKARGGGASVATVVAVVAVMGVTQIAVQIAMSMIKAGTAPAVEAALPKRSIAAPAKIVPLDKISPVVPEGFTLETLAGGTIRFQVPADWRSTSTAEYAQAAATASSMAGAKVPKATAIFSIEAPRGPEAGVPAAIHVVIEHGPAPAQEQLRGMLSRGDPVIVGLPAKTAEQVIAFPVPGVRMGLRSAEWADNGRLLCVHLEVEAVGDQIAKVSDQWNCPNSSSSVTLTAQYDADQQAAYLPQIQHAFDSLEIAIDQTIRLR